MQQKLDRRIERTHQLLADALVSLILEKGYEAVTIKDITERANVAYVTFFRHYKEKDELLVKMLEEVVEKLSSLMHEINPENLQQHELHVREGILIFQHAGQNSRLYRILLSSPGAMPIVKRVKAAIASTIIEKCHDLYQTLNGRIPIEIFANHAAAALLALIEWWLENDMPYPPERMADIYSNLVVQASWDAALGNRVLDM